MTRLDVLMLQIVVLLLLVRGTFAVDGKAGEASVPKVSLGMPNYSNGFEIALSSKTSQTIAGESNLVAFSFTSLSTSPASDEQETQVGFVNVYDRFSPGSEHPIYN